MSVQQTESHDHEVLWVLSPNIGRRPWFKALYVSASELGSGYALPTGYSCLRHPLYTTILPSIHWDHYLYLIPDPVILKFIIVIRPWSQLFNMIINHDFVRHEL